MINVIKWSLFLSILCTPLLAGNGAEVESSLSISAGSADYNGNQITLSDRVVIDHDIGTINADYIVLTPENERKKMRFAFLKMKDKVNLALKDGGSLSCAEADLDYLKLQGRFVASPEEKYVVYTESCATKTGQKIPLVVKSKEMNVQIEQGKNEKNAKQSSYINEITATDNVSVNYNQDFMAASDYALYQRVTPEEGEITTKIPGLITLRMTDKEGSCNITNRNGDLISATQIQIDTIKKNLHFISPKGTLNLSRQEHIDFSSDSMIWDDNRDLLVLRDHVLIGQKGIGNMTTDKEVNIYYYHVAGKKRIRSIETAGNTVLVYTDDETHLSHTLTSYGKITIDQQNAKTTMESPKDDLGKVVEGKQVYFQDYLGEIYADKVTLDYEHVDGSLKPLKVTLEGNVNLLNRSRVNREETEAFLQYAIADIVEFYPKKHLMMLTSYPKNRVLFFDKVNSLQVSAPTVKIIRDPLMKKESIQGIGDVRLNFIDQEFNKLKKHFSLDIER